MKYLIFLEFLAPIGCSNATAPVPPYSPGGIYYVAPGTFAGVWQNDTFVDNSMRTDTDSCVVSVTKSDSIHHATILNLRTGEILFVIGNHATPTTKVPPHV